VRVLRFPAESVTAIATDIRFRAAQRGIRYAHAPDPCMRVSSTVAIRRPPAAAEQWTVPLSSGTPSCQAAKTRTANPRPARGAAYRGAPRTTESADDWPVASSRARAALRTPQPRSAVQPLPAGRGGGGWVGGGDSEGLGSG
jgi:hypothetical protein